VFDLVECRLERIVSIDGEVGGDDGELRAFTDFVSQKVGDASPRVIVAEAGVVGWCGIELSEKL
jgi:hypothetical protein